MSLYGIIGIIIVALMLGKETIGATLKYIIRGFFLVLAFAFMAYILSEHSNFFSRITTDFVYWLSSLMSRG